MKRFTKKLLTLALALTVACTAAAPVTAQAAPTYNKTETVYRTSTGSSYSSYRSIYVSNLTKSQTVVKSSVKSTNNKIIKPYYLQRNTSSSSFKTEYFNGSKPYSSENKNFSYHIGLELKKAGTATVSFKIGKKTYKSKLTVKNYTNPLKTVTISGVNSGKNVASKLKKSTYSYDLKLKKTTKNAVVTVKPNSGWKITSIELTNSSTGDEYRVANYGTKGVSNASLKVGTLTKNKRLTLNVTCINTKDGGSMYCSYYINN